MKCLLFHSCNAVRDYNIRKFCATTERFRTNTRDATVIRDYAIFTACDQGFGGGFDQAVLNDRVVGAGTGDAFQRKAIHENAVLDLRDACRNFNGCE